MARPSNSSQLALPIESAISNCGLFADHFLDKRLEEMDEWKNAPDFDATFQTVLAIYRDKGVKLNAKDKEGQVEDEFIKPVLNALWTRDCYQIQPALPNPDKRGIPDYALFTRRSARDDAENLKGKLAYWDNVAVVGEAKAWDAPLDKARDGETPAAQLSRYLFQTNRRWGILTNGPIWRLYEQDKARQGGIYFEANLEYILRTEDKDAFKQFAMFFGRDSFAPDINGVSFVEKVLKGSINYAANVGETLKENVYDALAALMNGFFNAPGNALDRNNSDDLKRVHDTALIVLYRLLFILFAEDRGLLPVINSVYRPRSMRALQTEVNEQLKSQMPFLPDDNILWTRLCALCRYIDEGLEYQGKVIIPAYNGGLFSAARHPEIAPDEGTQRRWRIGDAALAPVIDLLAYQRTDRQQPGRDTVDYSSLEVQHLGSIYEGLLELQPLVASEALIEVPDGKKVLWKPQSEVTTARRIAGQQPRRVTPQQIYLATNRGERKASGSYYTPKTIVRYIVENTVGPLANAASARVQELRPKFDAEIARLNALHKSGDKSAKAQIFAAERALLAPYLELSILDPALGSGHFLVGAADYLSFALATDPHLPDLEIMRGEEPQSFYKRLVVEHCLYGVDLNPLAVELAKLSLWLHTVSRDRALSFLDHHLRSGNSLLGARLDRDLNHEPPRLQAGGAVSMASTQMVPLTRVLAREQLAYFLDVFGELGAIGAGDAQSERAKDALYRQMDAVRARYRGVANLWLAPFFGVNVSAQFYQDAVAALGAEEDEWNQFRAHETWRAAQEIAARKRFFHWHLEFPEVFLDATDLKPQSERGFDAVIGNPPYGIIFDVTEKRVIEEIYPAFTRNNDLYAAFSQFAVDNCNSTGSASLIVPNTFLSGPYFSGLKEYMKNACLIRELDDFSTTPVFEDPTVFVSIFIVDCANRSELLDTHEVLLKEATVVGDKIVSITEDCVLQSDMDNVYWKLANPITKECERKSAETIGSLCFVKDVGFNYWTKGRAKSRGGSIGSRVLYEGEQQNPQDIEYIKGSDFRRFGPPTFSSRYLKADYQDMLDSSVDTFRFSANYLQVPEKIVYRQTSDAIRATLDSDGYLVDKTVHVILLRPATQGYTHSFLLALLNSKLFDFLYKDYTREEGRAFAQVKTFNISKLPIRQIDFTTPADERSDALESAKQLYAAGLQAVDFGALLNFVGASLTATPSRGDVVHDVLAHLASEMMRLQKQTNNETNGFLEWLEETVGAKVNEMSNKGHVRAYADADFTTFLDVLTANKSRFKITPNAREPRKQLLDEWTSSTAKLKPLQTAITDTDELIDTIVYKLYGLNEAEIALVAGEIKTEDVD